jgi:hypothetical protein
MSMGWKARELPNFFVVGSGTVSQQNYSVFAFSLLLFALCRIPHCLVLLFMVVFSDGHEHVSPCQHR